MIGTVLAKYKDYKFRKKWRKLNPHNETGAHSVFPIEKVKVGKGTYGVLKIESWKHADEGLEIGNYCSIAGDVTFILGGNHSIDGLFTFPMKVKLVKSIEPEALSRGKIVVEDDVWIGTGATILSGVTIGRGSVIGAQAVVSRNIEPYSIVVGNPAKVVRKRFNDDVVSYLMTINFSKLDFSKINHSNVEGYYQKLDSVEKARQLIAELATSTN